MVSITYADVRDVLEADSAEVSDTDLDPEKRLAEAVVTDDLEPHSNNTSRLELTAQYLAAAYYTEDGTITSLSQGDRSVSFTDEGALGLWEKAKMADPTDKLGQSNRPGAGFAARDTKRT